MQANNPPLPPATPPQLISLAAPASLLVHRGREIHRGALSGDPAPLLSLFDACFGGCCRCLRAKQPVQLLASVTQPWDFPSGLHFPAGWSRSGLWGLLGRAQDPTSILLWRWVPAPGPALHLFPSPFLVHAARKGKGVLGSCSAPPSCIFKLVFGRLGTASEKCVGADRRPGRSCGCNHICPRLFSLRKAHVEGGKSGFL